MNKTELVAIDLEKVKIEGSNIASERNSKACATPRSIRAGLDMLSEDLPWMDTLDQEHVTLLNSGVDDTSPKVDT